jgi:hypothetical protein
MRPIPWTATTSTSAPLSTHVQFIFEFRTGTALAAFECNTHSNVMLIAGGGSFEHKACPKPVATSCRQGGEPWKLAEAGIYGDVSLSDGFTELAKTHEEIQGCLPDPQEDADQIYPGWEEKLGYTGEASVQAATFRLIHF